MKNMLFILKKKALFNPKNKLCNNSNIHNTIRKYLRSIKRIVRYIPNIGIDRFCPICKMPSKKFRKFGIVPREDAQCTYCGALERHRLVWVYLEKMTDIFNGYAKKVLHVAPEPSFERLLKKRLKGGYITADLNDPNAMIKMDITNIPYPDDTFDVVYCSHVLEHVPDDRRAIRELYRVLKTNGWALILAPITAEKTIEDLSITDPNIRLKRFGQEDHVRRYGPDFLERLEEVGFFVKVIHPSQFLSSKQILRMGITKSAGEIYYCTKR